MSCLLLLLFTLQEVQPTVFVGVPRVWEKFKDKIEQGISEASGIKEVIMEKARVSYRLLPLFLFCVL